MASLPSAYSQYQIILLGDIGTYVWLTCLMLLQWCPVANRHHDCKSDALPMAPFRHAIFTSHHVNINMPANPGIHLDEDFADVLALCSESERVFNVVWVKYCRLQWRHCAVTNTIWHQTVNLLPVWISRLKESVKQDAVKRYVAQEHTHT